MYIYILYMHTYIHTCMLAAWSDTFTLKATMEARVPKIAGIPCKLCIPHVSCRPMRFSSKGERYLKPHTLVMPASDPVCMHVCMYVCMCPHTLVMPASDPVCMYVCMYVCLHVCAPIHSLCLLENLYVCIFVCVHACMHACMYVCMYVPPYTRHGC